MYVVGVVVVVVVDDACFLQGDASFTMAYFLRVFDKHLNACCTMRFLINT